MADPVLCKECEGAAVADTGCPCGCGSQVCVRCAARLSSQMHAAIIRLWKLANEDRQTHG